MIIDYDKTALPILHELMKHWQKELYSGLPQLLIDRNFVKEKIRLIEQAIEKQKPA